MSPTPATPSPNASSSIPTAILSKLGEIEHGFVVDDPLLNKILDRFVEEFNLGLSKYGEPMAMIPTYVTGVPTGKEIGCVYAFAFWLFELLRGLSD